MAGAIIWLASYPKSGNTWLRLLLANLLSGKEEAVDINEIGLPQRDIVNRDNFEEITLIDSSLLSHDEVDALRPRVVKEITSKADGDIYVKVHDAYRTIAGGEPLLGHGCARAGCYVIRDPRDVAISFAFHCGISIEQAIKLMNNPRMVLDRRHNLPRLHQVTYDWSRHVESWIEQNDVPVHVIRYEDLHESPIATMQAAADFLGLAASADAVEHAVRCTDFSALQRQEKVAGFRERPMQSTAPFFRSGCAGIWREMLNPEQQQAITQTHHRVMSRFGYI